jgi:hypothetical protein
MGMKNMAARRAVQIPFLNEAELLFKMMEQHQKQHGNTDEKEEREPQQGDAEKHYNRYDIEHQHPLLFPLHPCAAIWATHTMTLPFAVCMVQDRQRSSNPL